MKKTMMLLLVIFAMITGAMAQDEKRWSLQAGMGETTMMENRFDNGIDYVSEDLGNAFYVTADYRLTRRLALTGGLTYEQQGLYTDYASGIGLKKINMLGVQAGAKFYFFPCKWVFQPHVGAAVMTNVLNLGHHRGEQPVSLTIWDPVSHGMMSYDVACPLVSLSPRIGVDIHLMSSVSLCVEYDWRFGLGGCNKGMLRMTDGRMTGHVLGIDERWQRTCVSVGLKMDFPVKPVTTKLRDNLLMLLHSWIASKTGTY